MLINKAIRRPTVPCLNKSVTTGIAEKMLTLRLSSPRVVQHAHSQVACSGKQCLVELQQDRDTHFVEAVCMLGSSVARMAHMTLISLEDPMPLVRIEFWAGAF